MRAAMVASLAILWLGTGFADDVEVSATQTVFGDLMEQAADYQIIEDSGNALDLEAKPILFWSNPTRHQDQKGCLVVWSMDGRPRAVGSLFTFVYRDEVRLKHEYHSLSTKRLSASYEGRTVWNPGPGIEWKPADGVASGNARRRLVQMRGLARSHTGYLEAPDADVSQLELKPTPLYRYESNSVGVIDGAIFSFSLGTDPEILMLIEARRQDEKPATWSYAFARFHYYRVFVKDAQGDVVWEGEQQTELQSIRLGDPAMRQRAYVSYHVDRQPVGER